MFHSRLPLSHPLSRANILEDHTLFPLYAPFMPPENVEALVAHINGNHRRLGPPPVHYLTQNGVLALRICPRCLAEDWRQDGELCWRRLHRAPGVVVCPTHRVFLIGTSVGGRGAKEMTAFTMPPESLRGEGQELDPSDTEQNDLMSIAEHARWVLGERGWRVQPGSWAKAYRSKLADLGERSISSLIRKFEKRFPAEFIARMGRPASIFNPAHIWLARLISGRTDMTHPPWRHFLLWIWLGIRPGQMRELLTGAGESRISGIVRTLPGRCNINSSEWIARLQSLYRDRSLSFDATCNALQASPYRVKRIARSFNLCWRQPSQKRTKQLERRKAQWVDLREQNPELYLTQLIKLNRSLYYALYNGDPRWLKQHQPEPSKITKQKINWTERDKLLLEKLRGVCDKMMAGPGPPERVSLSTLLRAISGSWESLEPRKRMPATSRFLDEVIETPIKYAMRRLRNAATQMQAQGEVVTPPGLRWRAKLLQHFAHDPQVRALIVELCNAPPAQSPPQNEERKRLG